MSGPQNFKGVFGGGNSLVCKLQLVRIGFMLRLHLWLGVCTSVCEVLYCVWNDQNLLKSFKPSNYEGFEQNAVIFNRKEDLQEKICLESISTHMVDSGPQQKTPLGRTLILFPWRYLKEKR